MSSAARRGAVTHHVTGVVDAHSLRTISPRASQCPFPGQPARVVTAVGIVGIDAENKAPAHHLVDVVDGSRLGGSDKSTEPRSCIPIAGVHRKACSKLPVELEPTT